MLPAKQDHAFRQSLSGTAIDACAIVDKIREEENLTIWTDELDDNLAQAYKGEIYPGMMFSLAKERMESTRLWKIIRRMPKGALLHAHLDALVDLDWLIDRLLSTPGMHISSSETLESELARERAPIEFAYTGSSRHAEASIWESGYIQSSLVSVATAANSFPEGGKAGFHAWLKGRCSISPRESLEHHAGPNSIWRKFASTFVILRSIIFYEPIFRAFVTRMCQQLLQDGVRWVDLRGVFTFRYRRTETETDEDGYEEMVRVLGEEVENFKSSKEGNGFWGARVIWTTLRIFGKKDIVDSTFSLITTGVCYFG